MLAENAARALAQLAVILRLYFRYRRRLDCKSWFLSKQRLGIVIAAIRCAEVTEFDIEPRDAMLAPIELCPDELPAQGLRA